MRACPPTALSFCTKWPSPGRTSFCTETKACPAVYRFIAHMPASIEHTLLFPARLAGCAASGVLLLAVSVAYFSVALAAMATPEPAGVSVEACSELSERRDRLHAEIERLRCYERTNQTDVGAPPLLALPSRSSSGTADEAVGAAPARRRGKEVEVYAVHCWAPNSSFTDPSCNCLGEGAHPKLGYRRTIGIIVGGWYDPPSPYRGSRSSELGMGLTRD
jgi:hypothetical protein